MYFLGVSFLPHSHDDARMCIHVFLYNWNLMSFVFFELPTWLTLRVLFVRCYTKSRSWGLLFKSSRLIYVVLSLGDIPLPHLLLFLPPLLTHSLVLFPQRLLLWTSSPSVTFLLFFKKCVYFQPKKNGEGQGIEMSHSNYNEYERWWSWSMSTHHVPLSQMRLEDK